MPARPGPRWRFGAVQESALRGEVGEETWLRKRQPELVKGDPWGWVWRDLVDLVMVGCGHMCRQVWHLKTPVPLPHLRVSATVVGGEAEQEAEVL